MVRARVLESVHLVSVPPSPVVSSISSPSAPCVLLLCARLAQTLFQTEAQARVVQPGCKGALTSFILRLVLGSLFPQGVLTALFKSRNVS